ncbi:MAG: hypothetical protein HYR63_15485 [Proteobacteria bacterium]|nr:hypothetical protein [Pseudomonadota bacterium]
MARRRRFTSEVELYLPVKRFLERQGYVVKGEVHDCDLVAVRAPDPPVVVELKLLFNLALVLQGVRRSELTDQVYLAVPAGAGARSGSSPYDRDVKKLCRMLGLGLIAIGLGGGIEVVLDPGPYRPRKSRWRIDGLLGEHARRIGDPNRGGSTRVPIVTAYRQEALRLALLLSRHGSMSIAAMRQAADVPNAATILQHDYYGWFQRVGRGASGSCRWRARGHGS